MTKRFLGLFFLFLFAAFAHGQGAKNIKINEVLTNNISNIQDEYGNRLAWIELVNTSFSTYNVRNMYVTTDRTVLDKSMPVPQRIGRMTPIPNHDKATELTGKQHLLLFLNSNPAKGVRHLQVSAIAGQKTWVALYDGNGVDLIDSVTVPSLPANTSYARKSDGSAEWVIKPSENVTPGNDNIITVTETKAAKLKKDDPYGFGITVLSMGIVFSCLALLYVFFTVFGYFMKKKQERKEAEEKERRKSRDKVLAERLNRVRTVDTYEKEIYMAVIAMAIKQYEDDIHDIESGIITIIPKNTHWTNLKQ